MPEPITILTIGGLLWLARKLADKGERLLVLTRSTLVAAYRNNFEGKNILILGARGTGKSSLIHFLQYGHPYRVVNGVKVSPEPTTGAIVLGEENSNGIGVSEAAALERMGHLERISHDVAGDISNPAVVNLWREIIRDVDPHGIIYMIDGRQGDDGLRRAVAELFTIVVTQYGGSSRRLRALFVFVNFADQVTAIDAHRRRSAVDAELSRGLNSPTYGHLLGKVRYSTHLVQLAVNAGSWEDCRIALDGFGTAIRRVA